MTAEKKTPRVLPLAAILFAALGATGCLIGKSEDTKFTGRYISAETLKQIEPGDDQDEVSSLLGEPSNRTQKSSGKTVWKYSYTQATTKQGAVFLLFGSTSSTQTEGAVYVEIDEDKKVVKTWSER